MNTPTHAIVAITLNCNARCVMCNIWKNKMVEELKPEEFLKLPPYLKDINVTGGEPFLRRDFPEVIKNIKKAAPKARLVVNTNGFLWRKIKEDIPHVLKIDPKIAIRLSIDGIGEAHNKIRGIPDGYNLIMKSLQHLRDAGVKDLGVSFTLMDRNIEELPKMQQFCFDNKLQFSLTIATNSPIYFGDDKANLRPQNKQQLTDTLEEAAKRHYEQLGPKEYMRGWFVNKMLAYALTGKRALLCDAGQGFFYMDSHGSVYTCNVKPWIMGSIRNKPIQEILDNQIHWDKVKDCHDCWMICTAKSMMNKRLFRVALESFGGKLATSLNH